MPSKTYPTEVMEALRALQPSNEPDDGLDTDLVHDMVASLGMEDGLPSRVRSPKSPSPTWIHPNLFYNTEEERFSLKSDGDIFGVKEHLEMMSEVSATGLSIQTVNLTSNSGGSNSSLECPGLPTVVGALPKLKEDLAVNMKQLAAREERLSYLEIIMDLMRENQRIRAKLDAANAALRSHGNVFSHVQHGPPQPTSVRRTHSWPRPPTAPSQAPPKSKGVSIATQTTFPPEVKLMGNKEMKVELKTLKSKLSKTRSEVRRLVTKRKTDQAMYEDKLKDANGLIAQLRRTIATITTRQMHNNQPPPRSRKRSAYGWGQAPQ